MQYTHRDRSPKGLVQFLRKNHVPTSYDSIEHTQRKKTFVVGLDINGKEKLGSYTTITFNMEGGSRLAIKKLKQAIKRNKHLSVSTPKAKPGFGSRKKLNVSPVMGILRCVKPLRNPEIAYDWFFHSFPRR